MIEKVAKYTLLALIVSLVISVVYDYIVITICLDDLVYTKTQMGQYMSTISADEEKLAQGIVEYPKAEKIQYEFKDFFVDRYSDMATEGLVTATSGYNESFGNATSSKKYSFKVGLPITEVYAVVSTLNTTGAKDSDGNLKVEGVSLQLTYVIRVVFGATPGEMRIPLTTRGNYRLVGDM